jgi:hypothetical protein
LRIGISHLAKDDIIIHTYDALSVCTYLIASVPERKEDFGSFLQVDELALLSMSNDP